MINQNRIDSMEAVGELLQQAVASGQVSAKQIEQHWAAGQLVGKTVLAMLEFPVPNVRFTERCGHAVYTAEQMQAAIESLRPELEAARAALSAMLTHMGMDEDEWNKSTFDQARAALSNQTPTKEQSND